MSISSATVPAAKKKRSVGGSKPGSVYDPNTHFYNGQIRGYLTQFMSLFSSISIVTDEDADGTAVLREVPIRFAGSDRQVASILSNNTENAAPAVPHMFVNIASMAPDHERLLQPSYEEQVVLRQRARSGDPVIDRPGTNLSIERLMPAPWGMTCNLDIVTSNIDNKVQIFEQIAGLFAGPLEFLANDSPTDWARLTNVQLSDTTWTSRAIPYGNDLSLDTMTIVFVIPIWISLPVKVSRSVLINEVRTTARLVQSGEPERAKGYVDYFSNVPATSVTSYMPTRHLLEVSAKNKVVLRGGPDANPSWAKLFDAWNVDFNEGETRLILRVTDNAGKAVRDVVVFLSSVKGQGDAMTYRVDRDTLEANDWIVAGAVDPSTISKGKIAEQLKGKSAMYVVVENDGAANDGWYYGEDPTNIVLQSDIISVGATTPGTPPPVQLVQRMRGEKPHDVNQRKYETRKIKQRAEKHVLSVASGTQLRWDPKAGIWHSILEGTFYPGNWKVIP